MGYLNAVATSYAERMVEFGYRWPVLPSTWARAATMSDFQLRLTAAESERLLSEIAAVIATYRRDDDVTDTSQSCADAALVVVQLQVMPQLNDAPLHP